MMHSLWIFIQKGRAYFPRMLLSIGLNVLTIGSSIALMGTSSYLITLAGFHPSIAELQVAIVGVRFFGISRGVFRYAERLVSHAVNFHILTELRVWFFRRYEAVFPITSQTVEQGDLLNRVLDDIDTLENLYVRVISPAAAGFLVTLITSLVLGSFQAQAGWILFIGLTLSGLVIPSFTYFSVQKIGGSIQRLKGRFRAQLTRLILGAEEIVVYQQEAMALGRLERTAADLQGKEDLLDSLSESINWLNFMLLQSTFIFTLMAVMQAAQSNLLNPVLIPVCGMIVLSSFEATQPLGVTAVQLGKVNEAIRRLEAVTEQGKLESTIKQVQVEKIHEIRFEHTGYTYTGNHLPAIRDVDICLTPGRKIAMVGSSGSGKSTIVQILQGFHLPTQGNLLVNNVPLQQVDLESYRTHLAVSGQVPFLFHRSLRKNLTFGNENISDEQLIQALNLVNLTGWLATLPKGLDTVIQESAGNISAGERQRLSIARAWLKPAGFLILDEPSANLDAESEDWIMQQILGNLHGRGLVWVTHRMKYLSKFDEVLFVQGGKILERGSEAELLQHGGAYFHYWQLQNEYLI
jgi:ATP-binding cassette, subfamily C, bacterial CydC